MAGLSALLGGYGSDDDEDEEQQGDASPAAGLPLLAGALTASPTHSSDQPSQPIPAEPQQQQQQQGASPASPAVDSDTDTQGRQPVRVIDGPTTNPEPLPEGLSPPPAHEGLNGLGDQDSAEADLAAAAAAGNVDPKFLLLPAELREAPPGPVHPHVQTEVETYLKIQHDHKKSVVAYIRKNRSWNNPVFLEKFVNYYHLDQYGTSFSPDVWDPKAIPEDDYWPALAQQLAAKKRQRGEQVKFASAGQQQAVAAPAAAAAAAAVLAMGQAPAAAPKMLPPDPRVEAAQAQAAALAKQLMKKSKWDK